MCVVWVVSCLPTAPTPPGPTPSCPSLAPLRSQNSTQEVSMHSHDYVELLIRQTHTPQRKSLTDRPVFNIIAQGTYNRTCDFHRIRLKQACEDPLSQTPYVLLDGLPVDRKPVGGSVLRSVQHGDTRQRR